MVEIDQDLAARLRAARAASKLSQPVLGERIGVTAATVSRIEAGKRRPSISVMQAWFKECGFEMEVVEVGDESRTVELVEAIESLTEPDFDLGLRFLRLLPGLPAEGRKAIVGLISAYEP
jgi:transcriptional regulator with XRE-family HTH domain